MTRTWTRRIGRGLLVVACLTPAARGAESPEAGTAAAPGASVEAAPPPLAPFSRLVGGSWQLGSLRVTFEWGFERRSVVARSLDAGGRQVAEARWFWHPARRRIVGYSVDAQGELGEMVVRFEGETLINELETFTGDGRPGKAFVGVWEPLDADHYRWTLFEKRGGRRLQSLSQTAIRAPLSEPAPAAGEGGE